MTKYKGELTRVPAISSSLLNILKVLKEEEKYEVNTLVEPGSEVEESTLGTLSESHEYFVEYRILETLAAYALTDEPHGFFKFLLGVIEDFIQSIGYKRKTSILSHSSVHGSIRQILRTIFDKLSEIPFEMNEDGVYAPNQRFIETQRPSVLFYTIDILKFINTLFFKFQNEVHLIRLLFCARNENK